MNFRTGTWNFPNLKNQEERPKNDEQSHRGLWDHDRTADFRILRDVEGEKRVEL